MAKTVKRTVDISYQAVGLDKIKNQMSKMEIFGGGTDAFKKFKQEFELLSSELSKNKDIKNMTPELAKELENRYKTVLKSYDKVRLEILKYVDEEAVMNLTYLNDEIEATEKLVEAKLKLYNLIQSNYPEDPYTGIKAGTAAIQKETIDEAGSKVLKAEDRMVGMRGRELSSPDSFIKNMNEIQTILKGVDGITDEINKKIEEGASLSEAEVKKTQEAINKAKENNELNASFKITAEEINSNLEIRNRLEKEQWAILNARKDKIFGPAEEDYTNAKEKLDLLKSQRDEINKIEIAESDLDETQKENYKVSKEMYPVMIELMSELNGESKKRKEVEVELSKSTKNVDSATKSYNTTLGKAANQVFNYGIAFTFLRKVYRETIKTITELDHALTEMAVVTSMSRKEAWKLVPTFQQIAKETGFASTEIAKLSTVYFRQGRSLADVIELTTVAAKAARIAGISAQESANYLTSAVNGFGLAANQALEVSDKFAALAASSASSYEELATGLSKFAAQANIAGMSIDFALGMLAKGVETTREAPETIGTALKTVIARMRELTDLGKTLEDGMDVNRVETALRQVGVQLRDTSGQFRDMEGVLTDIGQAWETLNTNQRASVAVALAGTRQQSRLIAIMNDFDRTLELVNTSMYSQGATQAQHMEYMKGMEAAMTGLQNAWQKFITSITQSEVIIGTVRLISNTISGLNNIVSKTGFIGKNLFAIIVSLIAVTKAYNVVNGIAIKLGMIEQGQKIKLLPLLTAEHILHVKDAWEQGKLNRIKAKSLILDNLKLKTLGKTIGSLAVGAVKWAAYWIAAIGPIGWALAGLAAVGGAVLFVTKRQERYTKKLKQQNLEIQKNIYEIGQQVNKLSSLSEKIDEINNNPIKVEADFQEIENFEQTLKELEDEKGIKLAIYRGGEFDLEQSIKAFKKYLSDQEQLLEENLQKNITNTTQLFARNEKNIADLTRAYSDPIMRGMISSGIELDSQQKDFIDSYVKAEIEARKVILKNKNTSKLQIEKIQKEIEQAAIYSLDGFTENVEKINSEETLLERVRALSDVIDELRKQGKTELISVYKDTFAELSYLLEGFKDQQLELIAPVLDAMGFSADSFKEFSKEVRAGGQDPGDLLKKISEEAQKLQDQGIPEAEAISMAFSNIASSTEDARLSTYLYGVAAGNSLLNAANAADELQNQLKNINEVQEKMMKGDISQSDLYDFINKHPDIFEKEGAIERFLIGDNMTLDLLESITEQTQDYENKLYSIDKQIEEYSKSEDKALKSQVEGLRVQRAQILAALQYQGALKNLTKTQYDYNNILKSYNRLSEMGLATDEDRAKYMEALEKNTTQKIAQSSKKIESSLSDLTSRLGGNWSDYIEIVNGVATIQIDAFKKLETGQRAVLEQIVEDLNKNYDEIYETVKKTVEETVKMEEEAADKKKKVYEDYFEALDRLENKRERTQSREDLVRQLQRLEGATDERSRQRAKEIRAQLIDFDKESSKLSREQSRKDLLSSIDETLEKTKKELGETWNNLIAAGSQSGEAFIQALRAAGFNVGHIGESDIVDDSYGYSNGGLVDYTGIARVHGSSNNPEAFLNADQTKIFAGLRDTLSQGNNSLGVTIGNITIQTQQLNNKQDFNSAGRALAEEFNKAIGRRGLSVNTKR